MKMHLWIQWFFLKSKRLLIHRDLVFLLQRDKDAFLITSFYNPYYLVSKSEEEIQELLNRKEVQLKEKEERRKQQEQNVTKKKEKREENK